VARDIAKAVYECLDRASSTKATPGFQDCRLERATDGTGFVDRIGLVTLFAVENAAPAKLWVLQFDFSQRPPPQTRP